MMMVDVVGRQSPTVPLLNEGCRRTVLFFIFLIFLIKKGPASFHPIHRNNYHVRCLYLYLCHLICYHHDYHRHDFCQRECRASLSLHKKRHPTQSQWIQTDPFDQ